MSFKDFITKNLIEVKDEKPVIVKPAPHISGTKPSAPVQFQYQDSDKSNLSPTTGVVSSSDLDQFRQHFTKLLADNNQPGNDYWELVSAKNVMNNTIPVESARYQTAFAVLSAQGLTKDIIIQSAQKYTNLIDNEMKQFQATFDGAFKQQVGDVKVSIEQKQKQMITLSQQINALNDEIKKLQDTVSDTEVTLTTKQNSFLKAGQEAKDTIAAELDKVNQFIQ